MSPTRNEALADQVMEAMRWQAEPHSASLLLLEDGGYVYVGSSTCIQIGESVFLASAGHNFDQVVDAEQIRIVPPKSAFETWVPFKNYRCTEERGDGSLDLAWIELEPDILENTDLRPLPLRCLKPREVPASTYRYVVQGSPGDLASHRPFERGTKVAIVSMGYFTVPVLSPEWPNAGDVDSDLVLKYDTGKTSLPVSSYSIDVPLPHGMSGGGVWTITNHPYDGVWSPGNSQLVGIVRSYSKSKGWLHCIKIHHWLEFLKNDFPKLARSIDECLDAT